MRPVANVPRSLQHALLGVPALALLLSCSNGAPEALQGYAEAEYRYLASPVAGSLEQLHVQRGDTIANNAPLFALEPAPEQDERDRLQAQLDQQDALIANLRTGQRPEELTVLRAQASQAQSQLQLSTAQWQRVQELGRKNLASTDAIDAARSQWQRDEARVQELTARLQVAKLGARRDEVRAAEAQRDAMRAQLAQAEWKLAQKTVSAPSSGRIQDTLFQPGEYVGNGQPVIVLLPDNAIKVRFYIPETLRAKLTVGTPVRVQCDGCSSAIAAEIRFVADAVEYTPPVLFNRDNRAALVYRAEAWPITPNAALQPGQPVDVYWQ